MDIKAHKTLEVPYASAVYAEEEIHAVLEVLKDPKKIVSGPRVEAFEQQIADLFGKTKGVMVNSGSSANLIAVEVLNIPEGSEVITPALTFSTTVAPLVQKRLVPVFVDVKPGTYLIDVDQIESNITGKTKLLMIPSLLGNIPDMKRLQEIAEKYGLYIVEDSCDTLGPEFDGRPTGAYSDVSTTSFYASHIITAAGGGGMACFRDELLIKRARIMSNWGRASTLFGAYEASEALDKRFAGRIEGDVYDAKFIFNEIGYNFQSNEIQGAFGLAQLKRLKEFAQIRRERFGALYDFFASYGSLFILPRTDPRVKTSWLAFPLTIKEGAPFTRAEITRYLEEHGIQTRPIFTGNILKQPAFSNIPHGPASGAEYPVTDYIMRNGFVIGAHHGLSVEQIDYVREIVKGFLNRV